MSAYPITAYIGFDCTAPSLHVGHLLPIMMLHWLQQTGHKPIALMGGGTTRVGDPSGKDETRKLLTDEIIEQNKAGIRKVFDKFLEVRRRRPRRRDHGEQRRLADQAQLHRLPARRRPALLGQPHAVVRLGEAAARARAGVVVPRIQLHDPAGLRLRRAEPRYGCVLQMGGSDQWGNIVNGIDLGRRMGARSSSR
jgi:tyrosyl-tRNA synthetase